VFGERDLMESTMTALAGESTVPRPINTIAGYSAFWITGQADFYRHTGDIAYLRGEHRHLLEILGVMDSDLDPEGLITNPEKHKIFVDWSPGFNSDTPEARAATQFEYALAYKDAAYLLTELGDGANAAGYAAKADRLRSAAQAHLLNASTNTFGSRWQTNAMAVLAGAATPAEQQSIWSAVLSHVLIPEGADTIITPYYGYYVLSAMAALNHRADALEWMRKYWGGMIAEGATSFWEAYDPRWPKQDFHAHLQADNKTGYYISLAHGWSAGPTAWLMEQVLGIQPTAAGFRTVSIRPDLVGLAWARGAEPTPRGPIRVDVQSEKIQLSLPPGTVATVSLPFAPGGPILQNGKIVPATPAEDGSRSLVTLTSAGDYTFTPGSRGMRQ
ncbi:MAG TPA: alpha-L-rhamnosidase C-terminal domain-containing protein, partial [Acidobacteriaceae bacterium]|nr:alpha-L-rhamnosidase C-terminal domain-containing protein [Acidobacteriaceae bacterium]